MVEKPRTQKALLMIARFALVGVLCLTSTMAFAQVAVADPETSFCVVDIFQSSTLANCADSIAIQCSVRGAEKIAPASLIWLGDEDQAGSPCRLLSQTAFTPRGGRPE